MPNPFSIPSAQGETVLHVRPPDIKRQVYLFSLHFLSVCRFGHSAEYTLYSYIHV